MTDLPGIAIKDYYCNNSESKLYIHDHFGPKVEMPLPIYFREEEDFPLLERIAMQHCKGSILDIGAGAGAHSLFLQENGLDVTALEISQSASQVMQLRGVKKVVNADFFTVDIPKFHTLLLLMNGIGICGTLDRIPDFLQKAACLLNGDGQIIFDSSDIQYMYDDYPLPAYYYGEVSYKYVYKRFKTDWFKWLYVDAKRMDKIATDHGWEMQVLFEDENDQYLAALRLK